MPETFDAFAVAPPGIAPLVADELASLGIPPGEVSDAGVSFAASRRDVARANMWLRTASRVIVRLDSFEAREFATLEKRAKQTPWADVLRSGARVQLKVTCRKSRLYHSDAVAERVGRVIEAKVSGMTQPNCLTARLSDRNANRTSCANESNVICHCMYCSLRFACR